MRKSSSLYIVVLTAFLANTFGPVPLAQAQLAGGEFHLPAPGVRVGLSPDFNPPILKGIKVHPDNPLQFDFILDQGDVDNRHPERSEGSQQEQLKQESTRLIKYFLASLTIPEKDLWVNLSPYEKDRIIPQSFGLTEMGRDLLAEDYMLKQITASLIYPEGETGKKFWKRIYEEAQKKFGTTNIPVNTFNKVWIIPEKAVVYENPQAGTAYVVESKLKVMLEQDYLALEKNAVILSAAKDLKTPLDSSATPQNDVSTLGSQITREIVIPELTKEVNDDKNFSQLRQVYNSLILATWYKKKIKDSILEQVYADKSKVAGVQYAASVIPAKAGIQTNDIEAIYQRYLQAFKKGVFNYIKEEPDPLTQETIPRKYFSGGFAMNVSPAMITTSDRAQLPGNVDNDLVLKVDLAMPADTYADVLNRLVQLPLPDQTGQVLRLKRLLLSFQDPDMPALVNPIKTSSGERLKILEELLYAMGPKVIDAVLMPLIEKDTPREVLNMVQRLVEGYDEQHLVKRTYISRNSSGEEIEINIADEVQKAYEKLLTVPPDGAMMVVENLAAVFDDNGAGVRGSFRFIKGEQREVRELGLRPLMGREIPSNGPAQKMGFQRLAGEGIKRQEMLVNPDEVLRYSFEVYTGKSNGVGELYAAVNDNKKEIFIKLIEIDPDYQDKGFASAALNLLRQRLLKDGYGAYQIKAKFSRVNPQVNSQAKFNQPTI